MASASSRLPDSGSSELARYSYAGNFLASASYGNGTIESRSYDAFGRLSALALAKPDASEIRDWNYSYDKTGNPLSDGTDSWTYDPLYRLKDASYGLSGSGTGLPLPETFAYSADGNRTSRSFGQPDGSSSGATSYHANRLDQYVATEMAGISGTGSDAYSYDLNGNLAETARYRFAYDWANRLVRVTEKARTVLVGSGTERKEIWLGSETDSGSALPPSDPPPVSDPPPADSGTSSGTETPPADSGTSSGTEVPPADADSGTADASGSGSTDISSGTTETGTGAETQSGTTDQGTGSGGTSSGATDSSTGSGAESGTGSQTESGSGTGTGGTSSGSVESQSGTTSSGSTYSGSTASGSTESGATVTETAYPERLVAEYSYDALGRRVSKTLADRAISYSYDGQKLIEETATDLSGSVIRTSEFAYGPAGDDDVLAEFRTESGSITALYYAKDRLGSTAAVTDASGNVLEEYRYSAFGSPYRKLPDGTWEALGSEAETLSGTVRPEPLTYRLYTGREWDSETGLHYYRARAYSPELGRFLQRDPVGTADQMNPYAYVRNNPLMWTDPTGMFCAATAGKEMAKGAGKFFSYEVGYFSAGAYETANSYSFGYLDGWVGIRGGVDDENGWASMGWHDGTKNAYILETAGAVYGGVAIAEAKLSVMGGTLSGKGASAAGMHWSDFRDAASEVQAATNAKYPHTTEGVMNMATGRKNPITNNIEKLPENELGSAPTRRGNAPSCKDGCPIEIHHKGQDPNGPFEEMTRNEHRIGDNFRINHPNSGPSQIDRNQFNTWKREYWESEWDSGRFKNLK